MNKKYVDFWDNNIKTPAWDRFKLAVEGHIEYLKSREIKDPNFKCECRVCRCGALNTVAMQ